MYTVGETRVKGKYEECSRRGHQRVFCLAVYDNMDMLYSCMIMRRVVIDACPKKLLRGLTSWIFAKLAQEGLSNHINKLS